MGGFPKITYFIAFDPYVDSILEHPFDVYTLHMDVFLQFSKRVLQIYWDILQISPKVKFVRLKKKRAPHSWLNAAITGKLHVRKKCWMYHEVVVKHFLKVTKNFTYSFRNKDMKKVLACWRISNAAFIKSGTISFDIVTTVIR